jgi:hypothetical protein
LCRLEKVGLFVRKKRFLSILAVGVLVLLPACGSEDPSDDATAGASAQAGQDAEKDGQEDAQQADLDDVPEVVAEVNGAELLKEDFAPMYQAQFQQMTQQSQGMGQEVDEDQLKKQVVDSMISSELLAQEAEDRDIDVSDGEVDKTLQDVARQNGMESVDALMGVLEQQGMGREDVEHQVRLQVLADELIDEEAGDIEPTDREVREFYDQMVAQQEGAGQNGAQQNQKTPPLKEVRPQVVQQLTSQKRAAVGQQLVQRLRTDAEISIHL